MGTGKLHQSIRLGAAMVIIPHHTRLVEVDNTDNPSLTAQLKIEQVVPGRRIIEAFPTSQSCSHGKPIWAVVVDGPDTRVLLNVAIGSEGGPPFGSPYVSENGAWMRTRKDILAEIAVLTKPPGRGASPGRDRIGVLRWVLGDFDARPSAIVTEVERS